MQSAPAKIQVDVGLQVINIEWRDGHQSALGLDGVRLSCPCAVCSGGHAQMGQPADPGIFNDPPSREWVNIQLAPIGNYALKFVWDDGHDAGIYTWQRLRDLCPCSSCYPINT